MALSLAGRFARRISESLPPDHAHEIAGAQRRRAMFRPKKSPKWRNWPDLPYGRRRRPAGARAGAGRNRRRHATCVRQLCELFGRENVYVELQRHFCREEEARNQAAVEIARKLHLPLLATNGVCHAQPAAARGAGRLHLHPPPPHSCHRRPPSFAQFRAPFEIARGDGRLFADLPEAIANTEILSSRLQFTLKDLGYEFPKYPVPDGKPQMHFLRERAREGMISRYGTDNETARANRSNASWR